MFVPSQSGKAIRIARSDDSVFLGKEMIVLLLLLLILLWGKSEPVGTSNRNENDNLLVGTITGAQIELFPQNVYRNPSYESGGSRISKSCYNYLLCETFPSVNMKNLAFQNGDVNVDTKSPKNHQSVKIINSLHASKEGHLPSCLASVGENSYDFIAGPKLQENANPFALCGNKWQNQSALFLFPWESHNAYHSLNDNILAVLSQLFVHRLLFSSPSETIPYKLYRFSRLSGKGVTTMYDLLQVIFGADIAPAQTLLKGGPHCLTSASWGSATKSFYRDSLFHFRSELYNLLRALLKARMPKLVSLLAKKTAPKVVIVSRGGAHSSTVGARKLSGDTERRLAKAFEAEGAKVSICDFTKLSTMEKFVEEFWDVDICVGVHGAGLSNCIFGRPGMIIVEFQTYHNYGFDSFMKIAHMAKGHYLFYDVRSSPMLNGGKDAGAQLGQVLLEKIVYTSLAMLKFSLDHLNIVEEKLHPRNMTAPDPKQLHSFTVPHIPDGGRVYTYKPPISGAKIQQLWFNQELIVDFRGKVFYYQHPDSKSTDRALESYEEETKKQSSLLVNEFVAKYLHFGTFGNKSMDEPFSVRAPKHFRAVEHAILTLDNLDKEQDISERFSGGNGKPRGKGGSMGRANFKHIDNGFIYTPQGTHKEVWIVFNPALFPTFPQATVFGPLMTDSYTHCVQLPYFKFRLMTQPWIEHRGECDRNLVQRKRSGGNDDQLLGRLIS